VVRVPKHAILLASKEWCEAASKGKVRIYHFVKPRRASIHALGSGSICVVLTKAKRGELSRFYGEFTVVNVREVGAGEWNDLVDRGLILSTERLRGGERRWIIEFEDFREYEVKIAKEELVDVRTRTSRKPISDWVIMGLRYIDEQALEGIRSKAGGFRRHKNIVDMIKEIGEILGFYTKTEEYTPDKVHRVDVTWRDHPTPDFPPVKVWEVETSGNVALALVRLKHAFDFWHSELYLVVSDAKTREKAESIVRPQIKGAFAGIERFLTVIGVDEIANLYNCLKLNKDLISKLVKRYA
jgi:hypothetical protein